MISKIAATLAACTAIGTSAWYAGDYTGIRPVIKNEFVLAQADSTEVLKGLVEQQAQMTTSVMELQFQTLNLKRKAGALDWSEEQDRCRIAKRLEYFNVEGCEH
jgi:hypothetical protein